MTVLGAGIVFGVAAAPLTASAMGPGPTPVTPAIVTLANTAPAASATPVGPTVETAAFHIASSQSMVVADQDVGPHVNRGLALTIAGIAAVGVGYAVKGEAGTLIALGGGALALYGVYHWIK